MQNMNDLRDLLMHEVQDLYSAEEQIIAALPLMIEKAKNPQLKKSLKEHLRITEKQRDRLQQVQQHLGGELESSSGSKGLLSRLFKSKSTCRGMQGIIEEGNMVINTDMDADVKDAAIICAAQKVEHYEICGYGTARSYARELGLTEVQRLLEETLQEEHMANDLLTQLAESRVNKDAEKSGPSGGSSRSAGSRSGSTTRVMQEEPELEMVSRNRSTNTGATGSTGRSGSASTSRSSTPSGAASRNAASGRNAGSSNTAGGSKRNTASGSSSGSNTGRSSGGRTGNTGSTRSNSGTSGRNR